MAAKQFEVGYPPYVVFKSDSPRTITPKFTQSGVTLQYSIDNGSTWNNISSGGTTASSDEIWFRGRATGTKSLYTTDSTSNAWVFSGDASNKLHVYGDLRYLLCNNLGDNTITFNISSYCFSSMFRNCTSLTTAPSLPATKLAPDCYLSMFENCEALTTAPSLPATTLASNCYSYMFRNCTSLTTAPSLPATTLADYCYHSMFRGCTAFKVSATQTESYQYAWRIPTSGTGTTASNWNIYMLLDTGGTFKGSPNINTTYYVENPPVVYPNPSSGYTITFNSNGGTTITDIEEATELPTLPIPTRTGYTFVAWYYESNFQTRAKAGDTIESDVTLYAKWYTPASWCKDIADAIREKEGSAEPIKHVDFAERITALPSPKEEEEKILTPDFSSGDHVIVPTPGRVLWRVTLNKPPQLIPENIKKDVDICGVVGTSFTAIELTQTQYDALSTKDSNTYYLIVEG